MPPEGLPFEQYLQITLEQGTAEIFGASAALRIIAAEGLVAVLLLAFWWRALGHEAGLRRDPGTLD